MPTNQQPKSQTRRKLLGWTAQYFLVGLLAVVVAIALRIGIGEVLVVCILTVIVFGLTQVVVGWVKGKQSQ